jgi:hypothetical protein
MTTNHDIKRLREEHETRVWRTFLWAIGLCLCAVILPLFSALGFFKPQAEPLGQWFARSGAAALRMILIPRQAVG